MHILQYYQFGNIPENQLDNIKEWYYKKCLEYQLKGLILLAPEGINLSVAGTKFLLDDFLKECYKAPFPLLPETRVRFMPTEVQPYKKIVIKIKNQIIPFPVKINHKLNQGKFIKPEEFHQLMKENKVIPVDTRNYYEWEIGTFKNALKFPIRKFRELPSQLDWFKEQYEKNKDKIIVTFCTGGIRCEKVVPFLVEKGFMNVYQIEGGILDYFEKFPDGYWEGECFVFDERYSILPDFKRGNVRPCNFCGQPIIHQRCVRCGNIQIA
ncbi:MAG: UPF0176 protein [Leptospiraceae bacterium]|nr:MAG: UPF0176 protein [Leptospiraceae bacterium]